MGKEIGEKSFIVSRATTMISEGLELDLKAEGADDARSPTASC